MSTPPRLVTQRGTFALIDMTVKYNVVSKENWGNVGAHDSRIDCANGNTAFSAPFGAGFKPIRRSIFVSYHSVLSQAETPSLIGRRGIVDLGHGKRCDNG